MRNKRQGRGEVSYKLKACQLPVSFLGAGSRSGTKKVASKGTRAPQLCPPLLSEENSPLTVLTRHWDGFMAVGGMVLGAGD